MRGIRAVSGEQTKEGGKGEEEGHHDHDEEEEEEADDDDDEDEDEGEDEDDESKIDPASSQKQCWKNDEAYRQKPACDR